METPQPETPQPDNVIKAFGDYRAHDAQQSVIDKLRECLAEAERGEIIAIAIAGLRPNDHCVTGWDAGSASNFALLGVISVLKDHILEGSRG